MSPIITAVVAIAVGVVCALGGYIYRKNVAERTIGSAEQKARNLILDAENSSETIKKEVTLEAKEEAHRLRNEVDKEIKERRLEVQRSERRLAQKEETIDRKLDGIEKREAKLSKVEKEIASEKEEIDSIFERKIAELEKISGYTAEEAKEMLLEGIEKECRHDASQLIKEIETQAKEEADRNAKEILTGAIQRCAADHVAESTLSVVNLPNDDMKGRIIGREGRNIRAIETLTGVDLIIDDTPEAVIVSGFDPIRREIARLALEKLIVDGRIHPSKIEEMIEKAKREVNRIIKEEGDRATFETGMHNLHPEVIKLLGRLHFRTSYGQNVLKHSIEVSHLAGLMAGELGLDVKLAKRAGLLHDIGKALDHEYEGTHVDIGVQVLKKYKERSEEHTSELQSR